MNAESHSSSALLVDLLWGPLRKGTPLNSSDLRFDDYVVTLSAPGAPRMPNGIECTVVFAPGARALIGRGRLVVGQVSVTPGLAWDPVPAVEGLQSEPPGPQPMASTLVNWVTAGPGSADELLAGYVAGLVILHGQRRRAQTIAVRASVNSNPLHATILRHAARGEVFEPVHTLMVEGDSGPLLATGAPGMLWLRGLVSAGFQFDATKRLLATGRRTLASQRR